VPRAFDASFAVLCVFALSILVSNQNTQRKDAKDRKARKEAPPSNFRLAIIDA